MNMQKNELLYLSDAQVEALVSSEKVFDLVEESFSEYSLGNAINPVKLSLPIHPFHEGHINSMPSYLIKKEIAGVKVVSVYAENPKKHSLPTTIGTVILNDPETGKPYSVMGGTQITSARTGAVMGVMAKYCAKKTSKVLTVVGAGVQGYAAFTMIAHGVPSLEEIRVVDIVPAAQDRFIEKAKKIHPEIKYVKYDSIEKACRGSDIILAAASAEESLYETIRFDKGATLLILEGDITRSYAKTFDKFVADFTECLVDRYNADAQHHAELTGKPFEPLTEDCVTSEIGDIITGKSIGRKNDDEIILAASVGMGIQDIIVANEAFEKAIENNVGTVLPL